MERRVVGSFDYAMSDPRASKQLLRQMAGALPWGVFFILAPFEVLLLGALVWIPLLIVRDRWRRYSSGVEAVASKCQKGGSSLRIGGMVRQSGAKSPITPVADQARGETP
jgi:hypothetical protein